MVNYDTPRMFVTEICDSLAGSLEIRGKSQEVIQKLATDALLCEIISADYGNEIKEDQ